MTRALHAVLVVEDEPQLRALLRTTLEAAGYRVIEAETARRAVVEARTHKPDLALVDLGLPDADGIDVIRAVREFSSLPVIVLSARAQEHEKVAALDAGADDYVTKPFGVGELLARVRGALRRGAQVADADGSVVVIGDWALDLARRTTRNPATGATLHLTPIEFRIVTVLAQHAGRVVTHRQLLRDVWGPEAVERPEYLRNFIKQLRNKLERDPARPRHLVTEIGVGYRLEVAGDDSPA
ncbi:MAG: response regulator [Proteobacteria bacterium]|nr:response regulator [Pseudomonadota bacterium]